MPVRDLRVVRVEGTRAEIAWLPSPERSVLYEVEYAPAGGPLRRLRVTTPRAVLEDVAPGTTVSVKAVNARGLQSWGAAAITLAAENPGNGPRGGSAESSLWRPSAVPSEGTKEQGRLLAGGRAGAI